MNLEEYETECKNDSLCDVVECLVDRCKVGPTGPRGPIGPTGPCRLYTAPKSKEMKRLICEVKSEEELLKVLDDYLEFLKQTPEG